MPVNCWSEYCWISDGTFTAAAPVDHSGSFEMIDNFGQQDGFDSAGLGSGEQILLVCVNTE